MIDLTTTLALLASGFVLGLAAGASRRRPTCRELMREPTRRGRKPSPPYSSAAKDLRDVELLLQAVAKRDAKFLDPSLGVPWEEGHTQRGNGSGGPTTSKPPIKPRFPPPRTIREDLL